MIAISVDAPADSRRMVDELGLRFALLADTTRSVIQAYGLVHEGGGIEGETIAVPAQLLVARDGTIAWKHVSRRVTDRVDPRETLAALARLAP